MPVHGEYRHLKRHAQLAQSLGMAERNILIPEIGNCVEVTKDGFRLVENVQAGARLIDGGGVEVYGTSEVMKDRLKMSSDGVLFLAVAVSGNYVLNSPVIQTHGCMFTEQSTKEDVYAIAQKALQTYDYERSTKEELSAFLRKTLKNYFYKKEKQSPLIVVSVLDV